MHQGLTWNLSTKRKREKRGEKTRFPLSLLAALVVEKSLADLIDYMTKRSVKIRARVWHGIYLQGEKEINEGKGKRGLVFPLSALAALIVKNTGRSYRLHDEEVG